MNILIALPAYRNEVKAECAISLVGVFHLFSGMNIASSLRKIDLSDVVIVRNLFGTIMLENPQYTHMLFLDNDMDFRPEVVRRMIDARVPLIGVVAPKRELDLAKFHAASKTMSLPQALSASMQFNAHTLGTKQVTLQSGIGTVDGIGLALALIERRVFVELAVSPAVRRERVPRPGRGGCTGPLHGFFDQIAMPDGQMLTEDNSFCERWRTLCGGEVKAIFDEEIGHHGDFVYRAKYPGVA